MKSFPQHFGPYELHSRVAIGGVFEVFRATRPSSTGWLALSRVQPFVEEELVTTMLEDLNLAAQARHPHLLRLEDFGQLEGQAFICTQFVDGFDLRPRKVTASAPVAAEVCAQLCDALEVAHAMGLVHGSVQADNVMISRAGDLKLRELGLAGWRTRMLSNRNVMMPTHFLSPEQLRGERQTFATDLFSVGLLLFELVTGRRPFERGSQLQSLKATLDEPIEPEVMELVPALLVPIVDWALQKDPLRRFESAKAMAEALRAASGVVRKSQLAEWARLHER